MKFIKGWLSVGYNPSPLCGLVATRETQASIFVVVDIVVVVVVIS